MAGLFACPECGCFVRTGDRQCPACEAEIGDRTVLARSAGAMIVMGLALTGCPDRTVGDSVGEEGGGGSSDSTMSESGSGSASSSASVSSSESASATASDSSDGTTFEVGPLYGPPATSGDETTGTGTGTGTDTDGDTDTGTGPQPLYGVVDT